MSRAANAAHLDPWCLVPLEGGETVLFGYALSHPATGGLAWLVSTEVLELDEAAGRAATRSGRDYVLGRRFTARDVGGEGEEARLAFRLLVEPASEVAGELADLDRGWLACCKAARHLGVAVSARTAAEVDAFLDTYLLAYHALRGANPS